MTFDLGYLFAIGVLYLSVLFLVAHATDRGWIPAQVARHPAVYSLSLCVYTTSWSFYGSVGLAQQQGLLFLAIYLGPTLAFILTPVLLAPILRLVRDYQLTSLADLFAFRYASQLVGILVTLFTLAGTLPYIALQVRAVTQSIGVLTRTASPNLLALGFCATLTVFAILFGTRHLSPRKKHQGLVVAIAFESLVKLAAVLAVGLFALFGVFGGPGELDQWLQNNPQALESLYEPLREAPWITFVLLSFAAAFLLPRQFHMGFVENLDPRALSYASWAVPLFLLLFNLTIPLVLWAGQRLGTPTSADYYMLGVTLSSNGRLLPTIAFLGGISAASAMVIVTTLALASMALNHLLLPASYPDPKVDLYRWLVWGRRVIIGLIITTSYGFYLLIEQRQGLVQLGLISFVAMAQFLPGIVGTLYWQRATRAGFLAGLLAGGTIWFTSLLMPLLQQSGIILTYFNLQEYLGAGDDNTWEFSTFWSLSLNALLFVAVSLATRHDEREQRSVTTCFRERLLLPEPSTGDIASPAQLRDQLATIIGPGAAATETRKALVDLGIDTDLSNASPVEGLRERVERNLSGMLGPMMAHMIVDSRMGSDATSRNALAHQMRFVETHLQRSRSRLRGLGRELDGLMRYHRQVLQDLPLGSCVVSADNEVLGWNEAMALLTDIPQDIAVGKQIDELPSPWNKLLGGFLDGDQRHLHKRRVRVGGRTRWLNLHRAATAAAPGIRGGERYPDILGGSVVLAEDLTGLQTLEQELAHSERLASIGRLAAGVAHEIGNPLTGIACITQNLQHEVDDPELSKGLQDILDQTRRIDSIVQTLVDFSHSGSEQTRHRVSFNLADCVNDAQRLVKLSRAGKQVCHSETLRASLPVIGDPQRIQQVIVNLLTNACDAVAPGGHVQVEAGIEGNQAFVRVCDDGHGIDEDIRERILEPFFTTKEPGQGTGLGLPLAFSIARDHGGTLHIESTPGKGTRVTLTLPTEYRDTDAQDPAD